MGCATVQLESRIYEQLEAGRLRLPSLPDLALQVNEITQSDRGSAGQVAAAVARDPALAARLIQAANSAASGSRVKVQSLPAAITRLGLQYTRALVSRLVIEQMFFTRQPALAELMRVTWARSVEVAALSEALASYRTPLRPEIAMLAGLLHLIGMLPLIRQVEADPDWGDGRPSLLPLLERLHPQVGQRLLKHWGFSPQLQEVPVASLDIMRDTRGPPDYTDLVIVSRLQLGTYSPPQLAAVDADWAPATTKLGLAPGSVVLEMPPVQAGYQQAMTRLRA